MFPTARRLTAAAAVAAGLVLAPAGAAGVASAASATDAATARPATASDTVSTAASWQYYDWYYFKADCQGMGRWLATEPLADVYDEWKCVYRGSWPFDYYDLYVR